MIIIIIIRDAAEIAVEFISSENVPKSTLQNRLRAKNFTAYF